MKREDLEALGLEKGVIDSIMALNGRAIESHKNAAQSAQSELETVKGQLIEANKQIEGFKGMKTQQEVDTAVGEWKTKFEQAQKDAADQISAIKFDVALKEALKEHKVKDPADVIPHLKRDALKLGDDGKFIGLNEQIEPLKTAKEYLFDSGEKPPKIIDGTNNQSVITDKFEAAMRQGANLVSK